MSVRTGWEKIIPHMVTDTFASTAAGPGVVESIDDKQHVITIRYDDSQMDYTRAERTPYTPLQIDEFHRKNQLFGYLVPASKIADYPPEMIVRLSKNTNAKIVGRQRCVTVESIPNYPAKRMQDALISALSSGKEDALYFITLEPMSTIVPGAVERFDYGETFTNNSGSYVQQIRVANVTVGERVKTGDVVVYNKGFFVPEYGTKQATFKHGVIATVVLMEKSTNHEDACEISPSLSSRLMTHPSHIRTLTLTADTEVHDIVNINQAVDSTDPLCQLQSGDVAMLSGGQRNGYSDLLASVGSSAPKADYYGIIKDIRIYYSCPKDKLSESLQNLLNGYEKRVNAKQKALGLSASEQIKNPGYVEPGSKYHGVDFTDTTVLIEVMITGPLDVSPGDKLCFGNSNKSVVSMVAEEPAYTESGEPVDAIFSTTSIQNRIVESPYDGLVERNVEELTHQCVDDFFA